MPHLKQRRSERKKAPRLLDTDLVQLWNGPQFQTDPLAFVKVCRIRKELRKSMTSTLIAAVTTEAADTASTPIGAAVITEADDTASTPIAVVTTEAADTATTPISVVTTEAADTAKFDKKLAAVQGSEKKANASTLYSKFTIKMKTSSDAYQSCMHLLAEHWPKRNSSPAAAESELWEKNLSLVGLWDKEGICLAVAVIEPQHQRFELSDDLVPQQIDTCLMIHALAMQSKLIDSSVLLLLIKIQEYFNKTQCTKVMVNVTPFAYSGDSNQIKLNKNGTVLISMLPPCYEFEVNNDHYIGVKKDTFESICKSDKKQVMRDDGITYHLLNFFTPLENQVTFTARSKDVGYKLRYIGSLSIRVKEGEKKSLMQRLMLDLFGIPSSEFYTKQRQALNSEKDITLKITTAGSASVGTNRTCAWEAFCSLVRLTDPAKASVLITNMHASQQRYSSLSLIRNSKSESKKSLIELMQMEGYSATILFKTESEASKLAHVLNAKTGAQNKRYICLLLDVNGASKHAVGISTRLVYDGVQHGPLPLTQESLNAACGIDNSCLGLAIVLEMYPHNVKSTVSKRQKRSAKKKQKINK